MKRLSFLAILAMLLLSFSAVGVADAKPGKPGNGNGGAKPPKARITWSVPQIEQAVAPGATTQVQVTFTSSADLSNLTLAAPGGLGRIMTVAPASFASVQAGVANTVTLTIQMPAENAHCQGGVLKVRAGKRTVPANLHVKVTLPAGCEP